MTVITEAAINRKISKAKLAKNGGVEVCFQPSAMIMLNGKEVEITGETVYCGDNFPHPDLLYAFEMMRVHYAIIAGQLDGKKIVIGDLEADEDFISLFKVTGFSMGGTGETEGVTLIGNKKVKRGTVSFPAPFTKFFDENNPYEFTDELQHLVNHAVDEINKYLDGKIAPDAQQKLDFDENQDLE